MFKTGILQDQYPGGHNSSYQKFLIKLPDSCHLFCPFRIELKLIIFHVQLIRLPNEKRAVGVLEELMKEDSVRI